MTEGVGEATDVEAFLSLLETVPQMEGHFGPPAPICLVGRFPYTDASMWTNTWTKIFAVCQTGWESITLLWRRHKSIAREQSRRFRNSSKAKHTWLQDSSSFSMKIAESCRTRVKQENSFLLWKTTAAATQNRNKKYHLLPLLSKIIIQKHKQHLLLECVLSHQCSTCRYERIHTN